MGTRHLHSTSFVFKCQGIFTKNFKGVIIIYKLFIAEIKKQLYLQKLTYKQLGKLAGYTEGTIQAFMSGTRESENMANSIAKVLKIER